MMMTNCWSCGARLSGPACQMCGAAQRPESSQPPPAMPGGSPGQPVVSQASMSIRPPSGAGAYMPGGQPGMEGYPQNGPYQQPGMSGSGFYPQPGYGQPYQTPGAQSYVPGGQPQNVPPVQMVGQQQFAPAMRPAAAASQASFIAALPLALVGGLVGGVIGALIWAFILQLTRYNISFIAIGLGFLVGLGVAFGARGRFHLVLAALAGALGLLSFFLALYFRLGLGVSDSLGQGLNPFALPFAYFFDVLKLYLSDNPINYIYFVLVPFVAIGTTYRYSAGNVSARRRSY